VLEVFGVLLLVAGAAVTVRWMSARTDALGRPRPFPHIAIGLLVVCGLGALTPFALRVRLEHRLGSAASAFVGSRVEVRCQTFGGAFVDAGADLGYVIFGTDGRPERWTLIKREQCRELSGYLGSDKLNPTRSQIVAVHVLSHESIHMSGVRNEAETECLAMQRDAEMARLLGAPPRAAKALAVAYWRDVYPWMPEAYRSDRCGAGLALDEGRPDAPWALAAPK
jgi:hypothetical protein